MSRGKKNSTRGLVNLAILLVFLIGAGILFYPTFSNMWNRYRNAQLITEYQQTVSAYSEEDYSEEMASARAYNDQHTVNVILDVFDENGEDYILTHPYDTLLNPTGNNVMGYVEIPKINVYLAIYHGTGTVSLQKGVGHIEGTSLPIGGEGTHAVLSAHRGLPSAKLFTDLDLVEEGDLFFVHVLNETLAYEVDQILTVLPTETEALAIEPGEDLVTLVTCTPYGVNTHRMLVRGHRTEYSEEVKEEVEQEVAESVQNEGIEERLLIAGIGVFFAIVIVMMIIDAVARRKRNKRARHLAGR